MNRKKMIAMAVAALLVGFAPAGCGVTVNGKPFAPGSSGNPSLSNESSSHGGGDGERGSRGSRGCGPDQLDRVARNGYKGGPCWDPPGRYDTTPPVHIVAGMRQMERTNDEADVYWFEMPQEASQEGAHAMIPTGGMMVADFIAYEPYASQDGLMPAPEIPDMLGEPLAKVLSYFDGLDQPFCLRVEWDADCQREPGTLCRDVQHPDSTGEVRFTFAGKRPR
jgi:hypothetical protein